MTIIALLTSLVLILLSYHLSNGNTALNLIASLVLTLVVTSILPDTQGLPFAAYIIVWALYYLGLQYFMPIADKGIKVRRFPHATGYQFGRIMIAVAVA